MFSVAFCTVHVAFGLSSLLNNCSKAAGVGIFLEGWAAVSAADTLCCVI